MATTKLKLYNGALQLIGERALASLSEEREPRRQLDLAWDDGAQRACLEQGQWRFATRTVRLDHDPALDPEFGYTYAFSKPSDWCCTAAVTNDEYFNSPLLQYSDEAGYWYADIDPIYVKYVSDDAAFGGDYSLWPPAFTEYVKAYLCEKIVRTFKPDMVNEITGLLKQRRLEALNRDAMGSPTKFPPAGSWLRSRMNGSPSGQDRGSRGRLIG